MEYITSVSVDGATKHIVRINGENKEVTECELGGVSQERQSLAYHFDNISVVKDSMLCLQRNSKCLHLAEIVFAIEVSKFIKSETD